MSGMFADGNKLQHKSVEWYTPSWVFDALALTFDLDPASPHDTATAVPAATKFTRFDDGLTRQWFGRVWLNPPYGPDTGRWMNRMAAHGNGIALVFSRTDASWCQTMMASCTAMLFVSGRIQFIPGNENRHKKGRCGAGTVLFAFGEECASALQRMAQYGVYLRSPKQASSDQERQASLLPPGGTGPINNDEASAWAAVFAESAG